jgi:type IV pilus assembly protein PilC
LQAELVPRRSSPSVTFLNLIYLRLYVPTMPLRTSHPSRKEVCLFTRQLATVLKAGVPLLSALATLNTQTNSTQLKRAIERIRSTLIDGGSLAAGIAATPAIFDRLYVSLVSSGERAGILDQTFSTLSKNLERKQALRARMVRAATYPALVLATLCGVTVFLLCWVIPTFEDLFYESGVQLPWLTQAVLSISRQMISYWSYLMVLFGCLLLSASWILAESKLAARAVERLVLRIPLAARLTRSRLASEFSNLLSALLGAGIPIIEALDITSETIQHIGLSHELRSTSAGIREGLSLTDSLKRSTVLPALVWQMAGIGEASGQLAEMLAKVGALFDDEVDTTMKTLHDLAEPVLIIVIGLIVGTLVLAIYLPLFHIGEVSGTG